MQAVGGFPDQPLFEDVELSLRIRQAGRWLYLGGGIQASARRWIKDGWFRRFFQVMRIYLAYLLTPASRRPARARRVYRSYYGTD